MGSLKGNARIALVLGCFSLLAIGLSHLALTDIHHGEVNVELEWWVLRISFLAILIFHAAALRTLYRVVRAR